MDWTTFSPLQKRQRRRRCCHAETNRIFASLLLLIISVVVVVAFSTERTTPSFVACRFSPAGRNPVVSSVQQPRCISYLQQCSVTQQMSTTSSNTRLSDSREVNEKSCGQNSTTRPEARAVHEKPSSIDANTTAEEVSRPTKAGGYTHTTSSKAKISQANKGKTPWNKGMPRSEEVKARIAEGVRRNNRARFLEKLAMLGLSEAEYTRQKDEKQQIKQKDKEARRTRNGGYIPTEETRLKISLVMKEKWARGEVKKREYKGPFRRGFTHSDETKEKIRAALKKKWAEDLEYQAKMKQSAHNNGSDQMRQRISNTLKEKWKDPEFRANIMEKRKTRKRPVCNTSSMDQREKISIAMKLKWQDDAYRKRAIAGMEKNRVHHIAKTVPRIETAGKDVTKMGSKSKRNSNNGSSNDMTSTDRKNPMVVAKIKAVTPIKEATTEQTIEAPEEVFEEVDDDLAKMRKERRDLYDLLYGEDDGTSVPPVKDDDSVNKYSLEYRNGASYFGKGRNLDDENLDNFDPYGLDDF